MHPLIQLSGPLALLMAALLRRTDRKLVAELRAAGAVDAAHPIAISTPSGLERWRLARLMSGGAVRSVGADTVYLDEQGLRGYRQARRRRALLVLAVVLALFVVGWLAGFWRT